jgi:hypothetical protein
MESFIEQLRARGREREKRSHRVIQKKTNEAGFHQMILLTSEPLSDGPYFTYGGGLPEGCLRTGKSGRQVRNKNDATAGYEVHV